MFTQGHSEPHELGSHSTLHWVA